MTFLHTASILHILFEQWCDLLIWPKIPRCNLDLPQFSKYNVLKNQAVPILIVVSQCLPSKTLHLYWDVVHATALSSSDPGKKCEASLRWHCNHLWNLNSRNVTDPLVHHGRHFGRTIHAMCRVHTLVTNGILREGELADRPEESFTAEYDTPSYFCKPLTNWGHF